MDAAGGPGLRVIAENIRPTTFELWKTKKTGKREELKIHSNYMQYIFLEILDQKGKGTVMGQLI